MQQGQTIVDVQKGFTHIVNHLMGLRNVFDKEEFNTKILKSLDRNWQPKVTAISEKRDITTLTTATLFRKLKGYELEINRLKEEENGDRKVRGLAFKSTDQNEENSEDCLSECMRLKL